jgi:hypothetical protein
LQVLPSQGGGNLNIQDGTLRAGEYFHKVEPSKPSSHRPSSGRYLLEANASGTNLWHTFEDITLSNIVFDGAGRAGGFACTFCNHVIIDRCFVYRFFGNGILAFDGHENYVSNSWVSQCNFNDAGPAATVNGTCSTK